jgi:hypothetical protein
MAKSNQQLIADSQAFFKKAQRQLQQTLNTGNPRAFAHGIDRYKLTHRSPLSDASGIGESFQSGRAPSDADVHRYIKSIGGNPFLAELASRGQQAQAQVPVPGPVTAPLRGYKQYLAQSQDQQAQAGTLGPTMDPVLMSMMMGSMQAAEQAKQETLARYAEAHGGYTDLRNRGLAEIDNWGGVQEQLLNERAAEALSGQQAMLADRGMANSNILPAFAARNARDLALEQLALSEKKSQRKLDTDVGLTKELLGVVERRNDTADTSAQAMMNMAMQYAASGAGKGFGGGTPGYGGDGTGTGIPTPKPAAGGGGGGISDGDVARFNRRMSGHGQVDWQNGKIGDPVAHAAQAFPNQMKMIQNPFTDFRSPLVSKATPRKGKNKSKKKGGHAALPFVPGIGLGLGGAVGALLQQGVTPGASKKKAKRSNPRGTAQRSIVEGMIARRADAEGNRIYAREQAELRKRRALAAMQRQTNSISPQFMNIPAPTVVNWQQAAPQFMNVPSPPTGNDWMTYYALGNK